MRPHHKRPAAVWALSLRYDLWLPPSKSNRTSTDALTLAGFVIIALAVCKRTIWKLFEQTVMVVLLTAGVKRGAPALRLTGWRWLDWEESSVHYWPHKFKYDVFLCTFGIKREINMPERCGLYASNYSSGRCTSICSCEQLHQVLWGK